MRQIKALVGKQYAQGTYQIFNRTLNHTVDFLNHYLKVSDTNIDKLDYDFFKEKFPCHNYVGLPLSLFSTD
jgi:hypothetical protein